MAKSIWIAAAAAAVAVGLSGIAVAQQAPAKGKAPAAAAQPQQPQQQQAAGNQPPPSAWVKLCEKAPFARLEKDGKQVREERSICLTHHERLDGNTGMVLVSAAVRSIEGQDKQHLMVMVPLGMALAPGLKTAVYNKDQWEKMSKNEAVDEKQLKPIDLKFTICHPAGCTAEVEATKELVDQMNNGGGMMVLAINAAAQPIGFPIPLVGFTKANAGPAVDNEVYGKARAQLMNQIRERQAQLIEEFRKQQAAGGAAPAAGQPAPAATGSNPAPKKQ
jgi:invasion protein IalB